MNNLSKKIIFTLLPIFLLSGCDILDLDGKIELEKNIKNANAIGAGCKQAGKSLESCYSSNPKAIKSAVFDGWKTMDEYMRENNMQVQKELTEEIIDEKADKTEQPQAPSTPEQSTATIPSSTIQKQ